MPNLFRENINGFIPQVDWLSTGFQVQRPGDPIDGLFGDEKTDNLFAQWQTLAAEYQQPFTAMFHAFNAEAQTTVRVPVDTHNIEKGLIKVKINQSERLRELKNMGITGDSAIYDFVMNDGLRLADAVVTRSKVAKNELMATGKVTIKENNMNLTVDYGVPAAQTGYTLDLATTADIGAQLQAIVDDAASKGVTLTGMMTSRKNITKMRNNAGLQTSINGNVGAGAIVRATALRDFLDEEFGIGRIIENDLTYSAPYKMGANGRPIVTSKRYFPDDKVTFFATNPAGRMGVGLWGEPPEVDNKGLLNVSGSSVSPYVYITQWMEEDPAVLWTKASGLFMPVLYNPGFLYIATVQP